MVEAVEEVAGPITIAISGYAWLPLVAVLVPLAGALVVALVGRLPRLRNAVAVASAFGALATVAAMYRPVIAGLEVGGELHRGLLLKLSTGMYPQPAFHVDAVGLLVAFATSLIWALASLYAVSYMSHEHAQTRFYSFLLMTLAANLGVLLAGDFFTLFLFFELMALCSYVLVVHGENPQSMRAGSLYLYMSVVGGLVLLGGVALLMGFAGTTAIAPATGEALMHSAGLRVGLVVVAMMVIGFGTKAGMFFLHVWLPEAHPVAPSPASALLSGLMVKVGVYGILRTVNIMLAPTGKGAEGWEPITLVGYVLLLAGAATMLSGMVNACFCKNCKELLAFSTISQVGYILLGLGVAAYMGRDGAMAMAGALYHIVNHAVFKSALFLAIGVVLWRTGEQELSQLGGLARYMPVTAFVAFLAMLSIIGVPGTAGFAGKSLIHEGLIEAYGFSSKLSPLGRPDWVIRFAEFIFTFTAAGTFAYSTRMFILTFLGKPRDYGEIEPESWPMKVSLLTLGGLIVGIGLFPNFLLEKVIGPALAAFGYEPTTHAYQLLYNVQTGKSLMPILYDPRTFSAWGSTPVTTNIVAIGTAVFFAGTFYLIGHKVGVFDMPVGPWWSLAGWYRRISELLGGVIRRVAGGFDRAWDGVIVWLMVAIWLPKRPGPRRPARAAVWVRRTLGAACGYVESANAVLDGAVSTMLVDAWLSEPWMHAERRPLRIQVRGIEWAQWVDRAVDRVLTLALLDVWLSEPWMHAERRPVRMHVDGVGWATRIDQALDRALGLSLVDIWSAEPSYRGQPLPPGAAEGHPLAVGATAATLQVTAPGIWRGLGRRLYLTALRPAVVVIRSFLGAQRKLDRAVDTAVAESWLPAGGPAEEVAAEMEAVAEAAGETGGERMAEVWETMETTAAPAPAEPEAPPEAPRASLVPHQRSRLWRLSMKLAGRFAMALLMLGIVILVWLIGTGVLVWR